MRDFRLTARQRQLLRAALKSGRDGAVVKRIVALLELDRGVPVGGIAERVGVTRQTVYNVVTVIAPGHEEKIVHAAEWEPPYE